jgi:hypothetical protein
VWLLSTSFDDRNKLAACRQRATFRPNLVVHHPYGGLRGVVSAGLERTG